MRICVLLVAASFMLLGCAGPSGRPMGSPVAFSPENIKPRVPTADPSDSPCSDSLYVFLKAKPLHEMSDREYGYFMQKDASCAEFQKAALQVDQAKGETRARQQVANNAIDTYTLMAVLGLGVSVMLMFALGGL